MNRVPMFIPGTVGKNGELIKGPFVPDSVPINATPLPSTDKPPGFPLIKPSIKPIVVPDVVVPVDDLALTKERIEKRRKKDYRGDKS